LRCSKCFAAKGGDERRRAYLAARAKKLAPEIAIAAALRMPK
jgi:hypothetical protein